MCIHCCRLRRTPCPPIPYSCPHCPVRTISSSCPLSRRSSSANPSLLTRPEDPPSDPCDTLPARWLEVNRRVIYGLAKRINRSPEAAHYAVLLLLYANYGKVMMIDRKRRSFRLPKCDTSEQDIFPTRGSLFNDDGFIADPMAPETLGKLLRMLQDYISRLRQLNYKFKWYRNGEDREEILCLLGEQDELVRLLRSLFGDSRVVSIPQLLRALHDLDLNYFYGKLPLVKSPWPVKSISKLYSEVVDPYKSKKNSSECSSSKSSENQIQEVTIHTIISPKKSPPKPHNKGKKSTGTERPGGRSAKHRVRHKHNDEQVITLESMVRKSPPAYLPPEMPRLLYEPYDSRKSSTWRSRYSGAERLLSDGRIANRRVGHYMDTDKQWELNKVQDAKWSVENEKDYGDMFGADMKRRRSTRKSLIGDKRKSLADR
ncbi:hypothetical protein KR200_004898 [Drosophila serrata]|nr:hypothetical protein KR200_004898 [Drosophila serrata]